MCAYTSLCQLFSEENRLEEEMALRQRLLSSTLAGCSSFANVLGGTDVHKGLRDLCRKKKKVQSYT